MDPLSTASSSLKHSINSVSITKKENGKEKSLNSHRIQQRLNHYISDMISIFPSVIKNISTHTKTIIIQVSSLSYASYLYRKILGVKPLESYKVANRVSLANEKLEPLIRDFFPKLKQDKKFDLWEKFCPRNQESQISYLLNSFQDGTCFGQTLILLFLMRTCASKDTHELRKELKKHDIDVLYFQALSNILCEIKDTWLKKKEKKDREAMKREMEQIGGREILLGMECQFFAHFGFNRFEITDKGLEGMVNRIEDSLKKFRQKKPIKNRALCIPIFLKNINVSDPSGHTIFVQLSPKHRLYDCMSPKMGFFEFSSEYELLQFLPKHLKLHYSSLCREIELPSVFCPEDGLIPRALIEVPAH